MTKLTDTQTILLSTASQRESGSLYPLPTALRPGGGTTKSIASLASIGLIEENETSVAESVARTDGDLRYGMFITSAGLAAIGAEEQPPERPATEQPTTSVSTIAAKAPRSTKTGVKQ